MIDSGQDFIIQFEHVNKWFGDFQVLKDIYVSVPRGSCVVICSTSGSGDDPRGT